MRKAFDQWLESDESLRPFGLELTEAFRLAAWNGWQAGAAAERKKLEADAMRYRFIKENSEAGWIGFDCGQWSLDAEHTESWDAAIDIDIRARGEK